ncbi:MAG: retron system putative HNH endonuclease [Oceanisphaera sp.]
MINIIKKDEPPILLTYRKAPDATYDGENFTAVKAEIRSYLLREQGYLCAYCMSSIENEQLKMKIEHWQSQKSHPERQLDYKNMLAVCKGNEGHSKANQHCDTRKADLDLNINPAQPADVTQEKIKYLGNGKIKADDVALDEQLNQVLNLNYYRLSENRKSVISAVQVILNKEKGKVTAERLNKLLQVYQAVDKRDKKRPYCGVAIYYLNKKLNQMRR